MSCARSAGHRTMLALLLTFSVIPFLRSIETVPERVDPDVLELGQSSYNRSIESFMIDSVAWFQPRAVCELAGRDTALAFHLHLFDEQRARAATNDRDPLFVDGQNSSGF